MVIAISPKEQKSDVVNNAIRELQMGKDNACGQVTLAVSVSTTVVVCPIANPTNAVFLTPITAHAAQELAGGTLFVSNVTYGQFTLTHASNALADRTFFWTIRGGS